MAERIARGIVPKWTNVSAANTMEYENALNAAMLEGHGSVVGLLHAVYTGDVDESVAGFMRTVRSEVRGCYQTWSEGVCGGAGNGEQPKLLLLPPGGSSSWHF